MQMWAGVMRKWPFSLAGGLGSGGEQYEGPSPPRPSRQALLCSQGLLMLGDGAELGCGRHSWEVGLFDLPVAWKDSDVETDT